MKKISSYVKIVLLIAAIVVGTSFFIPHVFAATFTVNNAPGCDDTTTDSGTIPFCTIQAAVNAAGVGDIVTVAAGTYTEHVSVNKALTINGAQVGVDARTRAGSETIVNGSNTDAPFAVTVDGVTLDGFTVSGGANGSYNAGISAAVGNLSIKNNIISANAIGVFANCTGSCLIEHNLFDGNNVTGSASAGVGIYADHSTGLTISNNEFQNHSENSPILFGATGPASNTNLVVSGNSFHDDAYADVLALGISGGSFTGNTVNAASDSTGFTFDGGNTDIAITTNTFNNGARGIRVRDAGYGVGGNSAITIHNNSFLHQTEYGVGNLDPAGYPLLDATKNWWGNASGPKDTKPLPNTPNYHNPSGTGSPVTPNVDYNPWYIDAGMTTLNTDEPPCQLNGYVTFFSDQNNIVDGHNAVPVTPHPAWVHTEAKWVWSQPLDQNGSSPAETKVFTKTFNVTGIPHDSFLRIAADNYYSVKVNGHDIDTGASTTTLDNFSAAGGAPHEWSIPAVDLQTGSNSIEVTVTNPGIDPATGLPFGDPNPAGVVYRLRIFSNSCGGAEPTTAKVHIFKYLDNGGTVAQVPDDSELAPFPMHASWDAVNLGGPGEGDYVLGNNHGGAAHKYAADTSAMQTPINSYNTYEITDGTSQVLPIGSECVADKFVLEGYKSGDSLVDAETAPLATTSPTYTAFSNDKYLIVVNKACPATSSGATINVHKVTNPAEFDQDFTFTLTHTNNNTVIGDTTANAAGTEGHFTDLPMGEYDLTETQIPGWSLDHIVCEYEGNQEGFSVPNGEHVFLQNGDVLDCTFTNTQDEGTPSAHIIVTKEVNGDLTKGTPDFHFSITDGNEFNPTFTLQGGESTVPYDVPAGTYTVSETGEMPSGWTFDNAECVNNSQTTGSNVIHGEQFTLKASETMHCTFTNTFTSGQGTTPGSITVTKNVLNSSGGEVDDTTAFTVCVADGNCEEVSEGSPVTFDGLAPGDYNVTEDAHGGYTVNSYSPDTNNDPSDGAQVTVTSDNDTPITVTNKQISVDTTPPDNSGGGGGAAPLTGGGGGGGPQGQVLGTSTGPTIDTNPGVLPTCATSYLTKYMRYGRKNSSDQVTKLQNFLNLFQKAGLPLNGAFGKMTLGAVKAFQTSQEQYIRTPWSDAGVPITDREWPTGYAYKTTLWRINAIMCPTLSAPVPKLP